MTMTRITSPRPTGSTMYRFALSLLLLMITFKGINAQEFMNLDESCLAVVKTIFAAENSSKLLCQTPSGMYYIIPSVDHAWIKSKMISGELFSGETLLDIPLTTKVDRATQTLQMTEPPKLMFSDFGTRRNLAQTEGRRTVLAVRIMASNSAMSVDEGTLANSIFGGNGDKVNLRSQYLACSHNKLEFVPQSNRNGLTTNIRNGVVTIRVNLPKEAGHSRMVNAVSDEIYRQFRVTVGGIADHVMYCLPKGTFDGVGYAVMNRGLSVYNDDLCTSVSSQMHEVGHNLNLGHSSQGNEKYGDQSGMMGYSYRASESPKMCFNAAQSWQLGWYRDKSVSFTPGPSAGYSRTFSVASIVDYSSTSNDIIIEIPQARFKKNLYIGYNAAKGMNSEVREGQNKVVVFEKPFIDGNDSWRVADLDSGGVYSVSTFNGVVGNTLVIKVLSVNYQSGVAQVKVTLNGARPAPTPAPTPSRGRDPVPTSGNDFGLCQGSMEICSEDSDCCSGMTCRRISVSGSLSFVCRSVPKQDKEKLSRTSAMDWGNRRLRGDASAVGAERDELEDA
eukprot:scaffold12924_cov107-Cylindrotheca_fusiformis.AAC.1